MKHNFKVSNLLPLFVWVFGLFITNLLCIDYFLTSNKENIKTHHTYNTLHITCILYSKNKMYKISNPLKTQIKIHPLLKLKEVGVKKTKQYKKE